MNSGTKEHVSIGDLIEKSNDSLFSELRKTATRHLRELRLSQASIPQASSSLSSELTGSIGSDFASSPSASSFPPAEPPESDRAGDARLLSSLSLSVLCGSTSPALGRHSMPDVPPSPASASASIESAALPPKLRDICSLQLPTAPATRGALGAEPAAPHPQLSATSPLDPAVAVDPPASEHHDAPLQNSAGSLGSPSSLKIGGLLTKHSISPVGTELPPRSTRHSAAAVARASMERTAGRSEATNDVQADPRQIRFPMWHSGKQRRSYCDPGDPCKSCAAFMSGQWKGACELRRSETSSPKRTTARGSRVSPQPTPQKERRYARLALSTSGLMEVDDDGESVVEDSVSPVDEETSEEYCPPKPQKQPSQFKEEIAAPLRSTKSKTGGPAQPAASKFVGRTIKVEPSESDDSRSSSSRNDSDAPKKPENIAGTRKKHHQKKHGAIASASSPDSRDRAEPKRRTRDDTRPHRAAKRKADDKISEASARDQRETVGGRLAADDDDDAGRAKIDRKNMRRRELRKARARGEDPPPHCVCDCGQEFSNVQQLGSHVRWHCKLTSSSALIAQDEDQSPTKAGRSPRRLDSPIVCKCGREFYFVHAFGAHRRACATLKVDSLSSVPKSHTCSECGKAFPTQQLYAAHKRSCVLKRQAKDKPEGRATRSSSAKQAAVDQSSSDGDYECVCGKRFKQSIQKATHARECPVWKKAKSEPASKRRRTASQNTPRRSSSDGDSDSNEPSADSDCDAPRSGAQQQTQQQKPPVERSCDICSKPFRSGVPGADETGGNLRCARCALVIANSASPSSSPLVRRGKSLPSDSPRRARRSLSVAVAPSPAVIQRTGSSSDLDASSASATSTPTSEAQAVAAFPGLSSAVPASQPSAAPAGTAAAMAASAATTAAYNPNFVIVRKFMKRGGVTLARPKSIAELVQEGGKALGIKAVKVRATDTEAEITDISFIKEGSPVFLTTSEDEQQF